MDPITIPPDHEYLFALQGVPNRPFSGSMTISDTTHAYVALRGIGSYQLCTRSGSIPPAGAHIPVSVTVNALDENLLPITPLVISFILDGPPPPAPAAEIVVVNGVEVTKLNNPSPADPGSATIDL